MTPEQLTFLFDLLKKRSGLSLNEDKGYLLESRLKPVARAHGLADLAELITQLRSGSAKETLIQEVTEAMTTNESMFFRDNKPFARLRETILPKIKPLLGAGGLNIWSAACSHGQEPYSLAMLLDDEAANLGRTNYRILATDLDTQVLDRARSGVYSQFEVQRGLQIQMLLKYFDQKDGNQWQVKEVLKQHLTFRPHNLLERVAGAEKYDIVFCRNVLIYFDEVDKRKALELICDCLRPHGLLFLGSAETVFGISDRLKAFPGEPGIFLLSNSTFPLT